MTRPQVTPIIQFVPMIQFVKLGLKLQCKPGYSVSLALSPVSNIPSGTSGGGDAATPHFSKQIMSIMQSR